MNPSPCKALVGSPGGSPSLSHLLTTKQFPWREQSALRAPPDAAYRKPASVGQGVHPSFTLHREPPACANPLLLAPLEERSNHKNIGNSLGVQQ